MRLDLCVCKCLWRLVTAAMAKCHSVYPKHKVVTAASASILRNFLFLYYFYYISSLFHLLSSLFGVWQHQIPKAKRKIITFRLWCQPLNPVDGNGKWRMKKKKKKIERRKREKNTQPQKAAASDNDLTFCGVQFNKKNKLTARTTLLCKGKGTKKQKEKKIVDDKKSSTLWPL